MQRAFLATGVAAIKVSLAQVSIKPLCEFNTATERTLTALRAKFNTTQPNICAYLFSRQLYAVAANAVAASAVLAEQGMAMQDKMYW